ncbi:MAG TPA: MBL fold metallo-hydrolase [Clostridia bacterium]|nr:MBL fold metallo-hydrolase [Clostridia bacterium]
MVEELFPGLFRTTVPIPQNPLKELNSYVIMGKDRNLIIDTGMNRPECEAAVKENLAELSLDLHKTDIFVTHMHADHSGLIAHLATEESKVYCSPQDEPMINLEDNFFDLMRDFIPLGGFPAANYDDAIKAHPGYKYRCREHIDFTLLQDGDTLQYGDYTLTVVATPGHTAGHLCLYEPGKKILFSGDHILGDITPNISLHTADEDPLTNYLASLEKVRRLPLKTVLPAHRSIIPDGYARIEALKKHHDARANEVLDILRERGEQNAYQVAAHMTWDMTYDDFENLPIAQKWFAAGEALAHLVYLETKGLVKKRLVDEAFFFSIK